MTVVKDTLDRWHARLRDLLSHPLTQPVVRAARTYVQTFLGVYLAFLLGDSGAVENLSQFSDLGVIGAANAASVVAVLAWVQNALETQNVPRG